MGVCVVCLDLYHPDYMMEKVIRGDNVEVCVFCGCHKKELTIDNDDGTIVETIQKKQASINYKKYLDDLTRKESIAKILAKQ